MSNNNGNNNSGDDNNNNNNYPPPSVYTSPLPNNSAFSRVAIIDGTRKIKYNTSYWVQRNVITVQILAAFSFDECKVTCHKESTSDVKSMETVSFSSFTVRAPQLNGDLPAAASADTYEYVFKKKLPHTSGRPETQKYIWLNAEFYNKSGMPIGKCSSEKFYVCSRPAGESVQTQISKKPVKSKMLHMHAQDKKHLGQHHVMASSPTMQLESNSSGGSASSSSSFSLLNFQIKKPLVLL